MTGAWPKLNLGVVWAKSRFVGFVSYLANNVRGEWAETSIGLAWFGVVAILGWLGLDSRTVSRLV